MRSSGNEKKTHNIRPCMQLCAAWRSSSCSAHVSACLVHSIHLSLQSALGAFLRHFPCLVCGSIYKDDMKKSAWRVQTRARGTWLGCNESVSVNALCLICIVWAARITHWQWEDSQGKRSCLWTAIRRVERHRETRAVRPLPFLNRRQRARKHLVVTLIS
jgi:hypothetical protein